ncbi:MAG TPA: tyrosine--tRNA ligase [Terriglobales bacterium]|nr:tyrosine--tRNA ligase [Terriglobales bacterium]
MPNFAPVEEQLEYIKKGAAEIIREPELRERLEGSRATGKPMRVYAGFDPTAPDLHLGHTVLLRKLKHFQELGHTVIFLIGDFTAMIGDPTGRNVTRPPLTEEEITRNARTYLDQVYKILDRQKTEVRRNSEWFSTFTSAEFVRLSAKYTVSQMLEREDFHKRFQEEKPISMHELLYPLAQGYDSFMLECDLQLGGTDQKFNLMVSREIARAYGAAKAEIVLTTPLLEGTDGVQKMSKSYGNYVGIAEPPREMFGKIMSISDELMWRYWELLTDVSMKTIETMKQQAKSGANPMNYKKGLAQRMIADFHGEAAAKQALEDWEKQFQRDEVPADVERVAVGYEEVAAAKGINGKAIKLDKLVARAGMAESVSDALRKIKSKAVRVDGQVHTEPVMNVEVPAEFIVRVGRLIKKVAIQ